MPLTNAQYSILKADILADPVLAPLFTDQPSPDKDDQVANAYKVVASPDFWAWRTSVSRAEIYSRQNDLLVTGAQTGFWNWQTYKAQNVTEQNAWVQMFMGDVTNFALANIRDGIDKIFSGSAVAAAQRDHCLAIGRRLVLRGERLFVSGSGTKDDPGLMAFEGNITGSDVNNARSAA